MTFKSLPPLTRVIEGIFAQLQGGRGHHKLFSIEEEL